MLECIGSFSVLIPLQVLHPLAELVSDFQAVRASSLALFGSFDDETLVQRGVANGAGISVRALAHIIAGHELHHGAILRERYGLA